jgi:hypothetical protein
LPVTVRAAFAAGYWRFVLSAIDDKEEDSCLLLIWSGLGICDPVQVSNQERNNEANDSSHQQTRTFAVGSGNDRCRYAQIDDLSTKRAGSWSGARQEVEVGRILANSSLVANSARCRPRLPRNWQHHN